MCFNTVFTAPIETCSQQNECLYWTFNQNNCNCGYEICYTLNLDNLNCVKSSSDTISHICGNMTNDSCEIDEFGIYGGNIPTGTKICKIVSVGEVTKFSIKDGNGCESGSFTVGETLSANCYPRQTGVSTCTGKECIWEVQAPDDCSTPSSVPASAPSSMPTNEYLVMNV